MPSINSFEHFQRKTLVVALYFTILSIPSVFLSPVCVTLSLTCHVLLCSLVLRHLNPCEVRLKGEWLSVWVGRGPTDSTVDGLVEFYWL